VFTVVIEYTVGQSELTMKAISKTEVY